MLIRFTLLLPHCTDVEHHFRINECGRLLHVKVSDSFLGLATITEWESNARPGMDNVMIALEVEDAEADKYPTRELYKQLMRSTAEAFILGYYSRG